MALAEAEPPVSATTAAPSVTAAPAVVPSPAAALRSLFSLFFISQFIFSIILYESCRVSLQYFAEIIMISIRNSFLASSKTIASQITTSMADVYASLKDMMTMLTQRVAIKIVS